MTLRRRSMLLVLALLMRAAGALGAASSPLTAGRA